MTKYCGKIGFAETYEKRPGVWASRIIEKDYTGDVLRNIRRWDASSHQNDDLNVNNSISIIADSYIYEHSYLIKYVTWMGCKWKVTNIEIQYPRLILDVGGVYNGDDGETDCSSEIA